MARSLGDVEDDRYDRLGRGRPDDHFILAANLAGASDRQNGWHITLHVRTVHNRRRGLARLWLYGWRLTDHSRQCDHFGAGCNHPESEGPRGADETSRPVASAGLIGLGMDRAIQRRAMPTTLLLPLLLRLAGPIAFVTAAMAAGAMNRSIMVIPLLALAATATTIIIRMVSPFPSFDLKSALSPDAPEAKPSPYRGSVRRFVIGVVGYGFAFGIAAMVAALFQATEFQPQIQVSDLGYFVLPAIIAVIGASLGARIGVNQMAGMMDQMQGMFSQMQSNGQASDPVNDEDGFTFEGEIIDPDEPKS